MGMCNGIVTLDDINDCEAFVARHIHKSRIRLTPDEFDELKAEGLLILCELHARFEPHRPGYDQPGWFSGYAAKLLPLKLQDAWRRLHPEHLEGRTPDGRRQLTYGKKPISLSAKTSVHPNDELGDRLVATSRCGPVDQLVRDQTWQGSPIVQQALNTLPAEMQFAGLARRLLDAVDRGHVTNSALVDTLSLDLGDVVQLRTTVASSLIHHQTIAA